MCIEVIVNKPFPTKQGLKIALEIARYELSSEQIDRIDSFINLLDNSFKRFELTTTSLLLYDLKECVNIFKKSQSIQWVREDFVNEVLIFENFTH